MKPRGVFVPTRYAHELGIVAATAFSQIVYWLAKAAEGKSNFIVNNFGHRWVAHSRAQLMLETGLTASQLRGALERLKEHGLIVVEQHLFGPKNIGHIRLQDGCPAWVGENLPAGVELNDLLKMAESADSYKKQTQTKNAIESDAQNASDFSQGNMKGFETKSGHTLGYDAEGEHPGKLAQIYRDAYAEAYPEEFLPPFSGKEMGQFKNLVKFVPPGEAGAIINFAVRNWYEVRCAAISNAGAFKVPAMPTLGFILSNSQSVVATYHESLKPVKAKVTKWVLPGSASKGSFVEQIVSEPSEEDKIATLEEVAESLGLNG